jgi:hypothetical protein
MPGKENIQAQVEGLATLLVLDDEIRKLSNLREFAFFSTNETYRLIPYHTAYLWQKKDVIGTSLVMQSGTAELDIHAPTNQWIKHTINTILQNPASKKIHAFDADHPELAHVTENWPETLPAYLLWCPLLDKNNVVTGGLLLFRESPFTETEIKMLSWLISSYQYTWSTLNKPSRVTLVEKLRNRPIFMGLLVIVIVCLLFPVHLTVLGSGTVVPSDPLLVNAPIEGIVKSIFVNPGDKVIKGDLLFSMDKTDLQANADVNEKNVLLTKTKLRAVINEGFLHKESNAEIPILQAQLAIDQANLDYTNTELAKAEVRSPIDGIVIYDNKEEWVGQPVHTGERILIVANPKQVELKVTIPVTDNIRLHKESKGDFFLYGALNPLPIYVTILGYNAKIQPNRILAYELKAKFKNLKDAPQIGAQGTVKLYGNYVPFIYYVFRKPLQAMRQTLGI